MSRFSPVLPLVRVALALAVVACDSKTPLQMSPESTHCAGIAGLATETYGEITITAVKEEVLSGVKRVHLKFAYPESMKDFSVGQIQCAYAFTPELAANPKRIPKATEVYFKGRYLSEGELFRVNSSMFKPRPLFKLND